MKQFILILSILFYTQFSSQELNLIPYPQKVEIKEGQFFFNKNTAINGDRSSFEYQYLIEKLKISNKTEFSTSQKVGKSNQINLSIDKNLKNDFLKNNIDGYSLKIENNKISLIGKNAKTLFYGIQTLLQLIETSQNGEIPNLEISDYPKFDYRGMHLDVSRHFFTAEEVKKYLDYLASYKYNKFHWHLTDDQGWRIEIKKYPKLTEIGAWRNGSQVGKYSDMKFDDKKYGGFYTQEQIKEVIEYGKKLHIDIIPEIEMPGHSVSAIASYPELSCIKGNFSVGKVWGVEENILCPKVETFTFLENVLDEVMALFPYEYLHIGGDEAPKTLWKESEFCQDLIKKMGLKNEHELQSYFIKRIEKYINSKGKKIIGWDEILEGGLAPNATVMSWSGIKGGIEAAKTGHKAIMTPTSSNYFDYYQGNPETEPLAFGGDIRLEKVYKYNPIPKELTVKQAEFIWGTQGNLWSEYILDFKQVEHMIFPRMMALSEVAWGTSKPEKYKEFESRVIQHFKILDRENIDYSTAIFEVSGTISQTKDGKIWYSFTTAKDTKNIRYTTDGSEPKVNALPYNNPIEINKSEQIKAAYFENGKKTSASTSQEFHFSKSTSKKITLQNPPSEAYSTGGAFTLNDAILGNVNFFGKNWLGFSGKDCVATIDLGKTEEISKIQFSNVERKGSWIYLPNSATVFTSDNGTDFKQIKTVNPSEIISEKGLVTIDFPKQKAKFVKVEIKNYGVIPKGQDGAENSAWLFVDEISVD